MLPKFWMDWESAKSVGDPETVAQRLLEYSDLGIETFVLSGYPHLEESYRVAEFLFPLLPIATSSLQGDGGVGAIVGNEFRIER